MDNEMQLSGRTMHNYKAFCQYFRNAGGSSENRVLTIEDMSQLLSAGVLFKPDADKVINLLSKITSGLESDCFKVIPVGDDRLLMVELNGKKFRDSVTTLNLSFIDSSNPIIIIYNPKIESRLGIPLDRKKYSGSDELNAFDLAIDQINKTSAHRLKPFYRSDNCLKSIYDDKGYVRYSIELNVSHNNNSQEAADLIVAASEHIQKAIDATNRIEQLHKARIGTLVEKLLEKS